MSTIVLVHGIAQEQLAADTLESQWLPALAGGCATTATPCSPTGCGGTPPQETSPYGWPTTETTSSTKRRKGAAGGDASDLDPAATEIAEELAAVWLHTAAERAGDARDQAEASRRLASPTQPRMRKGPAPRYARP